MPTGTKAWSRFLRPAKRLALKSNRNTEGRLFTALIMRLLRMEMRRNLSALCSLALAVMLTACGSPPPAKTQPREPSTEEVERILHSEPLHIGDKVRVELSGIPDKMEPMDRDIKDDGTINLA